MTTEFFHVHYLGSQLTTLGDKMNYYIYILSTYKASDLFQSVYFLHRIPEYILKVNSHLVYFIPPPTGWVL